MGFILAEMKFHYGKAEPTLRPAATGLTGQQSFGVLSEKYVKYNVLNKNVRLVEASLYLICMVGNEKIVTHTSMDVCIIEMALSVKRSQILLGLLLDGYTS